MPGTTAETLRRMIGAQRDLRRAKVLLSKQDDPEAARILLSSIDRRRFDLTISDFQKVDPATFDVVVPLELPAMAWLRANDPSGAGIRHLLPSAETVDLCDDKQAFNSFLKNHGFAACAPNQVGNDVFPRVVKLRRGFGGTGVHIVHDPADVTALVLSGGPDEYFCEELVPGEVEYTAHILFSGGLVRFEKTMGFRFRSPSYVKGAATKPLKCIQMEAAPYRDVLLAVLRALQFEGVCCFNYKIVDGVPRIFELNPRFGSSLRQHINPFLEAWIGLLRPR